MSRYIDFNLLLNKVNDNPCTNGNARVAQLLDAIMSMPEADVVEVKHGKWDRSGYCSECDYWSCYCSDFKYCPNCGAKMEGDKQ